MDILRSCASKQQEPRNKNSNSYYNREKGRLDDGIIEYNVNNRYYINYSNVPKFLLLELFYYRIRNLTQNLRLITDNRFNIIFVLNDLSVERSFLFKNGFTRKI